LTSFALRLQNPRHPVTDHQTEVGLPDVVFISMPFGPVMAPSIGLSLLKSGLARRGIASEIRYFSIRFAELVGRMRDVVREAVAHQDVPFEQIVSDLDVARDASRHPVWGSRGGTTTSRPRSS